MALIGPLLVCRVVAGISVGIWHRFDVILELVLTNLIRLMN